MPYKNAWNCRLLQIIGCSLWVNSIIGVTKKSDHYIVPKRKALNISILLVPFLYNNVVTDLYMARSVKTSLNAEVVKI